MTSTKVALGSMRRSRVLIDIDSYPMIYLGLKLRNETFCKFDLNKSFFSCYTDSLGHVLWLIRLVRNCAPTPDIRQGDTGRRYEMYEGRNEK